MDKNTNIALVIKDGEPHIMTMPRPIDKGFYGWEESKGFDSPPAGWTIEGGEEAYNAAWTKDVDKAIASAVIVADKERAIELISQFKGHDTQELRVNYPYVIPGLTVSVVPAHVARMLAPWGKHKAMPLRGDVAIIYLPLTAIHLPATWDFQMPPLDHHQVETSANDAEIKRLQDLLDEVKKLANEQCDDFLKALQEYKTGLEKLKEIHDTAMAERYTKDEILKGVYDELTTGKTELSVTDTYYIGIISSALRKK